MIHLRYPRSPEALLAILDDYKIGNKYKFGCRILINIDYHVRQQSLCDDDVTLRRWKFSEFSSRQTIGLECEDIMFNILVADGSILRSYNLT